MAKTHALRFVQLTVNFTLQVLGGCGAVWGCAEWLSLRGGDNNDNWRFASLAVGLVCLARWVMIHAYANHLLDTAVAALLLEVFGASGAIWGVAEIVGLRVNYPSNCHEPQFGSTGAMLNHVSTGIFVGPGKAWAPGYIACRNTCTFWRAACAIVFFAFLFRWNRFVPQHPLARLVDLHGATFVLDVLGGVGAVWGCSEVFGPGGYSLRLGWGDINFGQPSFDFWRIVSAFVFVVCLWSWVWTWKEREAHTGGDKRWDSEKPTNVLEDIEQRGHQDVLKETDDVDPA